MSGIATKHRRPSAVVREFPPCRAIGARVKFRARYVVAVPQHDLRSVARRRADWFPRAGLWRSLADDLDAYFDALIADEHAGAGDQLANLSAGLSAERADEWRSIAVAGLSRRSVKLTRARSARHRITHRHTRKIRSTASAIGSQLVNASTRFHGLQYGACDLRSGAWERSVIGMSQAP